VIPKGSYCPQFLTREEALGEAHATGDAAHDAEPAPGSHGPTPRTAEMEIEVLVADDHEMFRKGLLLLLQEEDSVTVVGEAADGRSAMDLTRKLSPDVVVMDVTMPGINGAEATRRILAESPDVKIIALSVHSGTRFVENMLSAGAAGYVLKEGAPRELVSAIQRAMRGEVYLSAAITNVVVSQYVGSLSKGQATPEPVQLTQKESDALRLIVEGHSVEQMAAALHVTARTARSTQRRLMEKLRVDSLEGLEAYARTCGALSDDEDSDASPVADS
jgi:LuxR family maltose regulon positive regulatory protein